MTTHVAYVRDQQVIILQRAIGRLPEEGLNSDGYMVVHIDFDIANRAEWVETHYYDGSTWQTRPTRPNPYSSWDVATTSWVWSADDLMEEVRNRRNGKLRSSDWTQITDAPISESLKTSWQTYRQALRDVPANNSSISNIDDVVWPTEPA